MNINPQSNPIPSPWTAWIHPLLSPTYLLAHLFFGAGYTLIWFVLGLDRHERISPRFLFFLGTFLWYFPMVLAAVMYSAASGKKGFPRWPNPAQDGHEMGTNTLILAVSAGLAFAPALLLCRQHLGQLAWPAAVDHVAVRTAWQLGCVFFALMYLSGTLQGELSGIQPTHLGRIFSVAGLDVIPGLLAALGVAFLPEIAAILADQLGPNKAYALHYFLEIQLWLIAARALGLMVSRHEEELGWFSLKPVP